MIVTRCTSTHAARTAALTRCAVHSRICVRTFTSPPRHLTVPPLPGGGEAQTHFFPSFQEGCLRSRRGGGSRRPPSYFAFQRGDRRRSLEAGDRGSGRDLLRASLAAAHVRMARVAACVARHRREARAVAGIALVVHQRP